MSLTELTLAIPTYNRSDRLMEVLHQLQAQGIAEKAKLLIVDDGSTDQTQEAFFASDIATATQVQYVRHEANKGYAHAYCTIFEHCRTPYVMLTADDDNVEVSNVSALLRQMKDNNLSFASPQFLQNGLIYRGKSRYCPISPIEFFGASAHAPGLLYKCSDARDALRVIKPRVLNEDGAACVYPQVCVLMFLLSAGRKCAWLNLPAVHEGSQESSGIKQSGGQAYWSVGPRWEQLRGMDNFLHALKDIAVDMDAVSKMRKANQDRVFGHMIQAMHDDANDLRLAFDRGAMRYYLKRFFLSILGRA